MDRRRFLQCLGGAAAGAVGMSLLGRAGRAWAQAATASAPAAGKLNFVFILADDLGWRDLGCCGSNFYLTPNIDKLAGEGMRFTQAYTAGPVCSPTRASIMTGKYPARLGITDWLPGSGTPPNSKLIPPKPAPQLPLEEVTVAEYLKAGGYTTACIGKWHLGARPYWPEKQGFDVNIAGNALGQPSNYFSPYKMDKLKDGPAGEYLTDRLTDEACKFIQDSKDRPFFLYLPHYAVHTPLQAKRAMLEQFKARVKKGDPQNNPVYAAMIAGMDEGVGKLMAKLDELGLAEKTVVVFFSDNGGFMPSTSNLPLRGGKGTLFEGGIRVPLIARWPGTVKAGATCETPVISNDFLPTLLEISALKPDPAIPCDGLSIVPLLKQTGKLDRDTLYWHYPHYQAAGPAGAIRQGDWKMLEWFEDGRTPLFNLAADPGEKKNLMTEMPEKVAQLKAALSAWRKNVNAPMPAPNPKYGPNKPASKPSTRPTP